MTLKTFHPKLHLCPQIDGEESTLVITKTRENINWFSYSLTFSFKFFGKTNSLKPNHLPTSPPSLRMKDLNLYNTISDIELEVFSNSKKKKEKKEIQKKHEDLSYAKNF